MVVSVGTFMGTMDVSSLIVALPTFGKLFSAPPELVIWLILAYSLTFTGFMLTAGRIADVVGRKRVYTAGFVVFTLGLALSSMAEGLWSLVACRVFQAIGGAMLVSNSNAIIASAFPDQERGKALGLLESVVGAGLMTGPVIGGFLLDLVDWRAIFYARVPIGVLGFVLAWTVLQEPARRGPAPRFDFGGALTLFGGLVCLMLAINQGHRIGWGSPVILTLFGGAALFLVLFFVIEARVPEPVIDLGLFRNRTYAAYNSVLVTYFTPSSCIPFLLPFYAVQGLGYTSSGAGLFLTVIPILMFALSPFTGTLSDRVGSWSMTSSGLALQVAGFFLIGRLGGDASALQIVVALGISGLGAGLFLTPTYSAVMGATPPERLGTSSALIATLRSIGMSVGQASAATIFAVRSEFHETVLAGGRDRAERLRQGLILGFQDTVFALAMIAVAGLVIAFVFARPAVAKAAAWKAEHAG